MFSVGIIQTKGGCSKSTVTTNLAVAATLTGSHVAVIDTDRQRSATNWHRRRRHSSAPAVFAMGASDIESWLATAGQKFDLCVVDTAAGDWRALRTVASSVDLGLIVSRPTVLDLEAAVGVRALAKTIGLQYATLITQAPSQLSYRLRSFFEAYRDGGEVVATTVTSLVAYQDAASLGLGVMEYEPHGRAAREIEAVHHWVWTRLQEQHYG